MSRIFLFIFFSSFLWSCNGGNNGEPVARVYNDFLYRSELTSVLPPNLNANDSIKRAEMFVNNWVREKVVLHQANLNLEIDEEDIKDRLTSYKNELIIYDYQNKLTEQKLNKNVTTEDARGYYNDFQDNFVLRNHVFKIKYAVFDEDTPGLKQFGRWMRADDEVENIRVFAKDKADVYAVDGNKWSSYGSINGILPIKEQDIVDFIRNRKYQYLVADGKEYFIKVLDYKLEGDIAPFEYVQNKIEGTIINKRKSDLLKKMREDLFKESINKGELEIFR
ncbi:MAG: hypothetical protein ACI8XB_000732 [Patiriisocius sp.]